MSASFPPSYAHEVNQQIDNKNKKRKKDADNNNSVIIIDVHQTSSDDGIQPQQQQIENIQERVVGMYNRKVNT